MKLFIQTTAITLVATMAIADADPKYKDPNVILADLRASLEVCRSMLDGQTNLEIFGITFTKLDDTCQYHYGELDDHIRTFLEEEKPDWAGVEGKHGLWVKITE